MRFIAFSQRWNRRVYDSPTLAGFFSVVGSARKVFRIADEFKRTDHNEPPTGTTAVVIIVLR